MPPGKKNQQSYPALLNIQFQWMLRLTVHTTKERSGWCANYVSNGSTVIVSCSKPNTFILKYAAGSLHFSCKWRQVLKIYITVWFSFSHIPAHWHVERTFQLRIFLRTFLGKNAKCCLKTFEITQTLFEFIRYRKKVLLKLVWQCSQYLSHRPLRYL